MHTVLFTKTARKDYEAIRDSKLKRGINRIIEDLKENPHQFKKLSGPLAHLRSAKTFSFRVLYEIQNKNLIVTVVAVSDRKDSYK